MTASVTQGESRQSLADHLDVVTAQLVRLQQYLRQAETPSATCAAEVALVRMLRGAATAQDSLTIGVPIRGARVVVVRCQDEHEVARVRRAVDDSGRVRATSVRPAEVTALVAEYPRRADQMRRAADAVRVATMACRTGGTISAGISSPLDDASQLVAAYQEAVDAARLAVDLQEPWAIADEHWAVLGARRLARHLASALTLVNPLSRLRQYDEDHGTDLVTTIGTWLANNCDTGTAAAALSVHPNTLRYRLRRATEVSGLNLDDPDVRAIATLLCSPAVDHEVHRATRRRVGRSCS